MDLVAVPGNPVQYINEMLKIKFVMKGGGGLSRRVAEGASHDNFRDAPSVNVRFSVRARK